MYYLDQRKTSRPPRHCGLTTDRGPSPSSADTVDCRVQNQPPKYVSSGETGLGCVRGRGGGSRGEQGGDKR